MLDEKMYLRFEQLQILLYVMHFDIQHDKKC